MATDHVYELRQYTLHPGRRDDLVQVFDRWFVEGQEDLGIRVQGQFYDLDRPDRFVWVRSFPGLEARRAALAGFYGGPVWEAHRDVANDTMMSWDDVLLLQSVSPNGVDLAAGASLPPLGSTGLPNSLISIDVHHLAAPIDEKTLAFFETEVEPLLIAAGSERRALLWTDPGPNTFPALPVREGEQVIVRVCRFADERDHTAYRERLARSEPWAGAEAELAARLAGPSQQLRLRSTARSRLR